MKTIIVTLGLLIPSLHVIGQSSEANNIEKEYMQCLDDSTTTAGMRNCTIAAMEKWDAELNEYYKLLMKNLSAESQVLLRDSQREWIKYRDKEFAFIHAYYFEEKEGTMWHPVADGEKMKLIKRRTIELKEFYETLED